MQETPKYKYLSQYQYGTLKFIAENNVTLAHLRKAHGTVLGSLAYRGYLRRIGHGDNALINLTQAGQDALHDYNHATMKERDHEGDLTERCQRLLKYSRSGLHKVA